MHRKLLVTITTVMALLLASSPASADPQGYVQGESLVDFFYGSFGEDPNVTLFAGGTFEDFCDYEGSSAPMRIFDRHDGSTDLKVNDKDHPIYLYYNYDYHGAPEWLDAVCPAIAAGAAPPVPFATGTADVKIRISLLSETKVDIFNSVNGFASEPDGTQYKVRAWADLIVENGVPLGSPEDFVGFKMTEIRR